MSVDWFRSWHGAPTDPKWLLIARNAMKRIETHETQITPGMVSAVVWALFDCASQAEQRGNVEGFDIETYSMFSGFSEAAVSAIVEELKQKSIIVSGCFSAWEKRQPKREDNSTERVRAHRNAMKRNETQCNAREDKEEIREEKKDAAPKGAQVVELVNPEKAFFDQAAQILGGGGRSLAGQLLKAKDRNVALAHSALLTASTKSDPREYIGAIIRGRGGGVEDLRARGEAW
jgi:hypothetical protein